MYSGLKENMNDNENLRSLSTKFVIRKMSGQQRD